MAEHKPWLSMWTRPRATIQALLEERPQRNLLLLAWVYGFSALLGVFQAIPLALAIGLIPMVLVAAVLAPLWGYIAFAIWTSVYYLIGKLFRGQSTINQVRFSSAWSCVPFLGNVVLWLVLILFFGKIIFLNSGDQILLSNTKALVLSLIFLGKVVFSIWALVIFVQALSQIEKFSTLRAVGTFLLGAVILIALSALLSMIAALLLQSLPASTAAMLPATKMFYFVHAMKP